MYTGAIKLNYSQIWGKVLDVDKATSRPFVKAYVSGRIKSDYKNLQIITNTSYSIETNGNQRIV